MEDLSGGFNKPPTMTKDEVIAGIDEIIKAHTGVNDSVFMTKLLSYRRKVVNDVGTLNLAHIMSLVQNLADNLESKKNNVIPEPPEDEEDDPLAEIINI